MVILTKTDEGWSYDITADEIGQLLKSYLTDQWIERAHRSPKQVVRRHVAAHCSKKIRPEIFSFVGTGSFFLLESVASGIGGVGEFRGGRINGLLQNLDRNGSKRRGNG